MTLKNIMLWEKELTFSVLISRGLSSGEGAHAPTSSSATSSLTWGGGGWDGCGGGCPLTVSVPSILAFSGSIFWMLEAMSSQRGGRKKTSSSAEGRVRIET